MSPDKALASIQWRGLASGHEYPVRGECMLLKQRRHQIKQRRDAKQRDAEMD
jgi:hypothetical protein